MPGGSPALIGEAPLSELDRPISKEGQERRERRLSDQISRLPFPLPNFRIIADCPSSSNTISRYRERQNPRRPLSLPDSSYKSLHHSAVNEHSMSDQGISSVYGSKSSVYIALFVTSVKTIGPSWDRSDRKRLWDFIWGNH